MKREFDVEMRRGVAEAAALSQAPLEKRIHLAKLADMLAPEVVAMTKTDNAQSMDIASIGEVRKSLRPRQAFLRFAQAIKRGCTIWQLLEVPRILLFSF